MSTFFYAKKKRHHTYPMSALWHDWYTDLNSEMLWHGNVEKNRVMRVSRQPAAVEIMTDQQLENVEYFTYLGSMITNDASCRSEIKSRIAVAKAAFNKQKTVFTRKLDLQSTSVMNGVVLWWNLNISESRSEIPGKFWNMVLVKDGDQLDGSYKKWIIITYSRGKEYPTNNEKRRLPGFVTRCEGTTF